ncbi:REM2- and Rab-like small GTPase 1 [Stylophora pistillata]|uniref:REM2-and Rab-like small GTPase 1 n=1 Tax=Stylophora pistillata TaxID=50429 RepID=A0A2B4SWG2_STYPI|nr:REM2- and Rab-like small GTPase 1 [Stylophora pistillata]
MGNRTSDLRIPRPDALPLSHGDSMLKESHKVVMFKLQFWDCGEHAIRKYDHLLPALKEKADAALFLFSFTDRGSFDDLPNQILNSDFTEQEIREFEEQWQVPVLRIANVTGKRLADSRTLDGRAGVMGFFLIETAENLYTPKSVVRLYQEAVLD